MTINANEQKLAIAAEREKETSVGDEEMAKRLVILHNFRVCTSSQVWWGLQNRAERVNANENRPRSLSYIGLSYILSGVRLHVPAQYMYII